MYLVFTLMPGDESYRRRPRSFVVVVVVVLVLHISSAN